MLKHFKRQSCTYIFRIVGEREVKLKPHILITAKYVITSDYHLKPNCVHRFTIWKRRENRIKER